MEPGWARGRHGGLARGTAGAAAHPWGGGVGVLGGCGRRARRHRLGDSGAAVPAAGAASSRTKRPLVPAGSRGGWAQYAALPAAPRQCPAPPGSRDGAPTSARTPHPGATHHPGGRGAAREGQAESARLPGDMPPLPGHPRPCWKPQPSSRGGRPVLRHPPEPGKLPGHTSVPAPVPSGCPLSASPSVPRLTPRCQFLWPQLVPSLTGLVAPD